MDTREFLTSLSRTAGVAGAEHQVSDLVRTAFVPLVGEVRVDKLGNCIALKEGCGRVPRPRVLLAAHMDEIGLMVTKVEERGFVRFTTVGGVDPRTLPAQEVLVHGRETLPGVIGVKPPHIMSRDEMKKAIKLEDMFIDLGLPEERVRELIRVGDFISLRREPVPLLNNRLAGKAMDDRVGVAVLLETLKELERLRHSADVYAVATVQEEVGRRGAYPATFGVEPQIGVAIDVTFAEMPGLSEAETFAMDKGPAITVGPNVHPVLYQSLTKAAQDLGMAWQVEVAGADTGTDAWAMQVSRSGVATAVVSVPVRYMHTSVELVSLGDIRKAGRLLAYFVAGVDSELVEGLGCF